MIPVPQGVKKSGQFFSYYFSGYKKRNNLITDIVKKDNDLILNIFDIYNFYPNISKDKVIRKLLELNYKNDNDEKVVLNYFNSLYTEYNANGIPIGPASSGFISNLILEDYDIEMSEVFSKNYFRYVDDIIIIS